MSFTTTRSCFYYGFNIDSNNWSIDFDEGSGELQATLNPGSYTLEEFAQEIKRAMDVAGALTYTVSVNRTNRKITIQSTANFELLAQTGTRVGTGVWALAGFSALDLSGASTYTSQGNAGSEFLPQAFLYDYTPSSDNAEKKDAVVNEAADGSVQAIFFGTVRYIEMNISLITDLAISDSQPEIEENLNGKQAARDFMEYMTTKGKAEFMFDRGNRSVYESVVLEKTKESSKGTEYSLKKIEKFPQYYETGMLVFRVIEV